MFLEICFGLSIFLTVFWSLSLISIVQIYTNPNLSFYRSQIQKLLEIEFGRPIDWELCVKNISITNLIMIIPMVNILYVICNIIDKTFFREDED